MKEQEALKNELIRLTGLDWPAALSESKWMEMLADHIDHLIITDFNQLVQLLYRIDIDEKQLKKELQEHAGERAGVIMANRIVERQRQKMESRKTFRDTPKENDTEEKW